MKLRIGAEDIELVSLDPKADDFGVWNPENGSIGLLPGLPKRTRATTLLHEVVHAVSWLYGLDLSERTTRVLEQGLAAFIRDNPDVAREIVEDIIGGERHE